MSFTYFLPYLHGSESHGVDLCRLSMLCKIFKNIRTGFKSYNKCYNIFIACTLEMPRHDVDLDLMANAIGSLADSRIVIVIDLDCMLNPVLPAPLTYLLGFT